MAVVSVMYLGNPWDIDLPRPFPLSWEMWIVHGMDLVRVIADGFVSVFVYVCVSTHFGAFSGCIRSQELAAASSKKHLITRRIVLGLIASERNPT